MTIQDNHKFKTRLGYTEYLCLTTTQQTNKKPRIFTMLNVKTIKNCMCEGFNLTRLYGIIFILIFLLVSKGLLKGEKHSRMSLI